MTKREFMGRVSRSARDILQDLTRRLQRLKIPYCVVGGLAVNAYAEPVVSLDLDIVVRGDKVEALLQALGPGYRIRRFPNSINVSSPHSDLRIQIQTDPRYQEFIPKSRKRNVLGYKLSVARREDVILGKVWAARDGKRRPSKRQKDLADILRLVETKKSLIALVPDDLKAKLAA